MQPNDPLYAQQWHLTKIGDIETIWDEYSGAGVTVGVYDDGVQSAHADLAGNYDPSLHVIIGGNPLDGEPNATSPIGHGTAVAGVLAASANNGAGGVGVAWGVRFASVDIIDPSSTLYTNFADSLSAFHQMANFDITNNSWNALTADYNTQYSLIGSGNYVTVNEEYAYAVESGRGGLGTIIVQGIGNSNLDAQHSGVNATRFTISVGATNPGDVAAVYSNYGACVLVSAPGGEFPTGIVTTDLLGTDGYNTNASPTGDYSTGVPIAGTSLATPIISGVAALMLDANAGLGWRDVQNIFAASARHIGSVINDTVPGTNEHGNWFLNDAANWNGGGMHFSNDYGYGIVDAHAAVRMAEVWTLFGAAQTTANEKQWFNWDDTDYAIPDDGSVLVAVNLVPDPLMTIEHVDVQVGLDHPDFTTLRIFLEAPDGTEIELSDGSATAAAAAFDGGRIWSFGVDALRGANPEGEWTLTVQDVANDAQSGSLTWFQVGVYGSATSTNDTYHYTDEFLTMAALSGEGGRTTLTDAGGADWIDAAAVTGNVALNLGTGASVDSVAWFAIAGGTVIENAVTGDGNDSLTGNGAANRLYGMRGGDTLEGNGGDDILDGGAGADLMKGGANNDNYFVNAGGDTVDETGGNGSDTVNASISFDLMSAQVIGAVEHLTLLAGAINAFGNGVGNVITGNATGNTIDGRGGADVMRGMGGSDTYIVDAGDVVDETGGDGSDSVFASVSFTLGGGVENLTLSGGGVAATGNGIGNVLTGNGLANTLDGQGGADLMRGLGGNDSYVVDNAGDVVDENATAASHAAGPFGGSTHAADGNDTVFAFVDFSLADAAHALGSLENLTLQGGAVNGTGNGLVNLVVGNAVGNVLDGLDGSDTLTGGGGADRFVFSTAIDKNKAVNLDHITDFAHLVDDIVLSKSVFTKLKVGDLKKGAFFAGKPSKMEHDDRVIYSKKTGELAYDKDGDGHAKAIALAVLDGAPHGINAKDFLVVA